LQSKNFGLMMESYEVARVLFLKSLALIYCVGFLNVVNQYLGLLGEKGLLPVGHFIQKVTWKRCPTVFWMNYSDSVLKAAGWFGFLLGVCAFFGFSERSGFLWHVLVWGGMWVLYLSFVNIGQVFYGFGWESLLLETGFVAIFFPPENVETPVILIWILRWLLFRLMFGAGLIKLRGDKCWWDLTCMYYYYETQPMPNPLSWYFHQLKPWMHRTSTFFTHFVELVIPWAVLFPGVIGYVGGGFSAFFMLMLIVSGNLSWLNYLSLLLCFSCFDDAFWSQFFSVGPIHTMPDHWVYLCFVYGYAAFVAYRSWEPAKNLVSRHQLMNTSYDPFHLVNSYGAFGSITRRRFEIIIEGTSGNPFDEECVWKEYEFKGKPGSVSVCPPQVAPYHMRLDWLMWFAAMGSYHHHPWTVHLVKKLLENEKVVMNLLKYNPFADEPPEYIRAELYLYKFAPWGSKDWWVRERAGSFLPPMSLDNDQLLEYCRRYGWI